MKSSGLNSAPVRRNHRPNAKARQVNAGLKRKLQYAIEDLATARDELEAQTMRETQGEHYAELYDFAPVGYLSLDRTGMIHALNLTAAKLFGRERRFLIGHPMHPLIVRTEQRAFLGHLKQLREGKSQVSTELFVQVRDRPPVPVQLISAQPVGKISHYFRSALVDLTERESARATIAAKESQLRLITDITPVMLARCSRDLRYQFVNRAYAEFLGLTPAKFVGKLIDEVIGEAGLAALRPHIQTVLSGELVEFECWMNYLRAGARFLRVSFVPEQSLYGEVSGWVEAITDITERKRAEQMLSVRDATSRCLVEAASLREAAPAVLKALCTLAGWDTAALWLLDRATNQLVCVEFAQDPVAPASAFERTSRARRFKRGQGLPGQVWSAGKPICISDLANDDEFIRSRAAAEAGLRSGIGCPVQASGAFLGVIECFNRERREPAQDSLRLFSEIADKLGQFIERTRAEQALRESENRFRLLASQAPVGIFRADASGATVYVNETWCALTGFTPAQALGSGWLNAVHPEDRERVTTGWVQTVKAGAVSASEFRVLNSGSVRWVLGEAVPLLDGDGQLTGYIGTMTDITTRKEAEETLKTAQEELERRVAERTAELTEAYTALLASEAKFRGFVESAPDAVVIAGADAKIILVNAQTERLFGFPRTELTGQPLGMLLPKRFHARYASYRKNYFSNPRTLSMGTQVELCGLCKDGSEFPADLSLSPLLTPEGTLVCVAIRDATQRKRAEQALRESEARLQAILNNSTAMIFLKDTQGRYLLFNHEFERAFDLSLARDAGKTDAELFPKEEAAQFRQNDLKVLKRGEAMAFDEVAMQHGVQHTSIVTKFPLRDAEGKIYAIGGIVTDITEREQLEKEILEISDREQRRIARDLHDGLGQQLAGVSCLARALHADLFKRKLVEAAPAARISQLLNTAVSQTRSLARGLYAVPNEPGGLMNALKELAANLAELFKVACRFRCPQPVLVNDLNTAAHLYRIAQEAATNAIRHGRASSIDIELASAQKMVTLRVSNNGAPLPPKTGADPGMGLRIINYRARVIGGTFAIQNQAGGGVEVVCELPASDVTKPSDAHG